MNGVELAGNCLAMRRDVAFALIVCLGLGSGCSSDQPAGAEAPSAEPVTQPAEPQHTTAAEQPAATAEDVQPSPEQREAASAFATMTAQNITPEEWDAAHQKLQEMGATALPVLLKGMQSDVQVEREMASTMLALVGADAQPAAGQLRLALEDESMFVRANVATALLQMPEQVDAVLPVVSEILKSDEVNLRQMAAMNLANLAAVDAEVAQPLLPTLIERLDDEDRVVVYHIVQLLGRLGPGASGALPKLEGIDAGDDEELQAAITTAVEQISADDSSK